MMKKQNVRTLSFIICTFTYLLFGAAIFDALESQTEENIRIKLEKAEKYYKSTYNITDNEYDSLENIVIKYHPYRTFPQWKFKGAFYFSLTVITTIGYGHSTPQTIFGKTFCMIYAMVGIPLCLIMFQSVGERFNHFVQFCIEFVKKCIKMKKVEVNPTENVLVALSITLFAIMGGAMMFAYYEGWSYFNSIYYCVITLTTIGFGDYVALQDKTDTSYVIFSFTFILFGLTVVASTINLLILKFLTMNTEDERREEYTRKVNERRSLELSQSNLVNLGVNGNVLCTFNTENLDDLKKENKLNFYQSIQSSLHTFLRKQFTYFADNKPTQKSINNEYNRCLNNNNNTNGDNMKMTTTSTYNSNEEEEDSQTIMTFEFQPNSNSLQTQTQNRTNKKKQHCAECISHHHHHASNNINPKKGHYTVRRAPGKISHLIPANSQNNDLIIKFDKYSNKSN